MGLAGLILRPAVALLTPALPPADYSKTSKTPRRPYEKERLDSEMKVVGEFGLKNKREVWRIQVMLAKMRKNARDLLTLDEKNPKRIFEGAALLRRCARLGLLEEDKRELDYVLAIKTQDIMARRLQTLVFKQNLAKSLHHARVLIRQRHIRYAPASGLNPLLSHTLSRQPRPRCTCPDSTGQDGRTLGRAERSAGSWLLVS